MPRFQLPIAVVLVISTAASLILFFLTRATDGKIQLLVNTNAEDEDPGHDAFDVTKAEDLIDGYPVDAESFWARMRWRKAFISLLLAFVLVISTASLGWSIANDESYNQTIYSMHVCFALYAFLLSARSIGQNTTESHSESILHLTVLLSITFGLLGVSTIVPQAPSPINDEPVLMGMWYALIGIYAVACTLCYTTPLGPPLHYPPSDIYSEKIVQSITNTDKVNVCGVVDASPLDILLFSYTTKVVWLGNIAASIDIGDLPILPANMRATFNYARMRRAMRVFTLRVFSWTPTPGSGWLLAYRLVRLNYLVLVVELVLSLAIAFTPYIPPLFLRKLVQLLEVDTSREQIGWGWVYVIGLTCGHAFAYLMNGQVFSLANTTVQTRLKIQLNSILYAKTLVRKDVATSDAPSPPTVTLEGENGQPAAETSGKKKQDGGDFSSKAQIMTLMTTDVDRVAGVSYRIFQFVDAPVETVVGTFFLYNLLGVSCFFGLGVTCLFLPLNHYSGNIVLGAQDKLMKARDERVSLMNEILGGIRMLKFMGWERSFEKRVHALRNKELRYQRLNYTIETLWNTIWNGTPILITLTSFWHFAVIRGQPLTPSIAFTSILVFAEMRFALGTLPETIINLLQGFVSLRRIEKYLNSAEVDAVPPLDQQSKTVSFQSCTATWPSAAASTSANKFRLVDLSLDFPQGDLSLICGKLGSGKTLLLLALLGEADVLSGQVLCPRSPPDSLASFVNVKFPKEHWVVEGICAYVPQTAWLRNASIRDNILLNLPFDEQRYLKTLEVCALISDLDILEDGDESEIGERGVNLSGGQKARVSLARAVYSRASILLLDDILSAVDAHTAHHLYHECLRGELMIGRTIILVSHHVQLCTPGASYIVALDNGRIRFEGSKDGFYSSGVFKSLVNSSQVEEKDDKQEKEALEAAEKRILSEEAKPQSGASFTAASVPAFVKLEKKSPRKLVEEEKRAIGHIDRDIWETYIRACGNGWYWLLFVVIFIVASVGPILENGWLGYWSHFALTGSGRSPAFYISIYAVITLSGLVVATIRWFILYAGSIHASDLLYKQLLESVLFADIRFHDTASRGRLLNRFGKDFEGIDSNLSDAFGRTIINALSAITTLVIVSVMGGPFFFLAASLLCVVYWNVAKIYGQTTRDMRRLDSVSRSPIYSLYGETISGVTILRAFGASSQFLRDMLRAVDTNTNPFYWRWGVNRWLMVRFNMLSSGLVGATGIACLLTPNVSASLAGFALAFVSTIPGDLIGMVRRFVHLEQSMIALERVKEYTDLKREPPEYIEPRPPASWPSHGAIKCEDLVIRYARELPDILHHLNFEINPGEKVGILGRTGSGKSTLALSFFRFVEAAQGRILIDGIDTSKIGLTDLRSRLTIVPQDPTILSGSLRSTLDVFDEYQDPELYEALRRVHLIPSEDTPAEAADTVNANVFRDLDSKVSEGGDNFSTGEKQLLCMARAILKRSKVLVMDEATASVDYATDELIGKTIRQEFATNTILTIAHRLRTVIDYDRVMILEQGSIIEFDRPAILLNNEASKFYALCKATGKEEFAMLKKLAGV